MQMRESQTSEIKGKPKETALAESSSRRHTMSGILKRKLEEGPAPYLSLHGSEDDDVSCSDSGNSSDSLNHPVPSGLLDSTLQQSKRMRGRNVHFESVTVYYFSRRQGFTSVPTQGGSTLGMSPHHSWVKRFSLREFALEQRQSHWNMLRDHLKEEKLNTIKLKVSGSVSSQRRPEPKPTLSVRQLTKNGTVSSVEADTLTLDDISEDDLDVDSVEVDHYFFLQPLTTRQRRALLRSSGVRRIDVEEKHELRALRMSREECGCRCPGVCDPETCACSLAGIKCQVDRMSFPCGCTKEGCSNTTGRLEFNPVRVRTHFLHTIMKLELERSREEQNQQQQQPPPERRLVTNGNGYHSDSSLAQQQQQQQPSLQFPLVSAASHVPIMHLTASDTDQAHLDEDGEEEEEDEEEEGEEEEEDDEAYEEDEDGSSVCSGLSDCSTHSLDTIDPEEGEEDEEDDEEEDDEEEEDEEEDDWDSSTCGTGPPPYSVPLPSMLSYTSSTLMTLGQAFHSAPSLQRYQTHPSGKDTFLSENVTITLPTVETALESTISTEPPSHSEQQSVPCHLPGPTEPLGRQPDAHVDAGERNTAPAGGAGEQQPKDLQNSPELHDSQTAASACESREEKK